MAEQNLLENVGKGFVAGVGVDSILWAATAYVPQLAQPSGIKVPRYDPRGIHYDDLLALGISGAVAASGLVGGVNTGRIVQGISMALGSFIISQFQPMPVKPTSATTTTTQARTSDYTY